MKSLLLVLLIGLLSVAAFAESDRSPASRVTDAESGRSGELTPAVQPARDIGPEEIDPGAVTSAPLYHLNWWSVNGGGETNVNGTTFDLGVSVGQAAAGLVTGTTFRMGVGYWYGAAGGACPITVPGDLNSTSTVTSADVIALVNYVFKGGAAPVPCAAAGDINCSGTITSADIIALVNYVFKGGAAPCNVCTIIPSMWSCP